MSKQALKRNNIRFEINDYEMSDDEETTSSKFQEQITLPMLLVKKANNLLLNAPIDNINICFVGGVSTGKSTILNAIFCEELTQCKIKRTTMVPTVYIENENNSSCITQPETIFKKISEKNKELIEKSEETSKINKIDYQELMFNVGKLDINILEDSHVNVYDIPGLNDAKTKDIYYSYLEENFQKFNLIILLVDIHSGLNTSDEIDIVNFVTNNTRYQNEKNNKKIYTLVVVNKADDMQLDEESEHENELILTGELNEMFAQVENTINSEFKRKGILEELIGIIPLCAIDAYLYRMVKKHGKKFKLSPEQILKIGVNENGKKFSTLKPATQEKKVYEILNDNNFIDTMIKLSGFSRLETILHKFLERNNIGKEIRINNLVFELSKERTIDDIILNGSSSSSIRRTEIQDIVEKHMHIYNKIKKIDHECYIRHVSSFIMSMNTSLEKYLSHFTSYEKTQIINFYEYLKNIVFKKYFSEFMNVTEYPDYLKEHVVSLILSDFIDRPISLVDMMKNFTYLNNMNHFIPSVIKLCIDSIMSNRFVEKTIIFIDETNDESIKELISFIKDCEVLKIKMSKFIRFVLINYYNSINNEALITKQMIFKRHGEIAMYAYLTNVLMINVKNQINIYINGLTSEDIVSKNNSLEMFYINYEIQNNPMNIEICCLKNA